MIIQISLLVVSLTSLFAATYAWYNSTRQVSSTVSNISVESGINTPILKYYTGNKNASGTLTGYYLGTVTDYATDFIEPESTDETPFGISGYAPKYKYTYSLEVTAGFMTSLVRLNMTQFYSTISTIMFDYATKNGISLASAINIYGTCFAYSDNNNTANANAFVSQTSSDSTFDRFDYDSDSFTSSETDITQKTSEIEISSGLLGKAYPETTHKIVFLFTIEFSNDSSTFYSSSAYSTDGTSTYYAKDTSGDSNVYSSLTGSFKISKLSLVRDNEYSIKLNTRGGSIGSESAYILASSGTAISLPVPVKAHYTFAGWYDPSANLTIADSSYTWSSSADIPSELYALWTINSYTVTFDPGLGTVATDSINVPFHSYYPALPIPTYSGYNFDGWFTAASGGTQVNSNDLVELTNNITLFAHYTSA